MAGCCSRYHCRGGGCAATHWQPGACQANCRAEHACNSVAHMPSQAFMKRTLEAHPLMTNDALVREVEKAADVYARYYLQGTLQDPAPDGQEWSLEAVLGCFESSTCLRLYLSDGAHVTCSSASARSVSRRRHVCIAYWPVWCVIPPSVCLQHVWQLPSKAGAVADGPVLGAVMSVKLAKRGHASDLSWGRNTDCRR